MSHSSARGQVEPTAALVVLLAVCSAVSTYAVALDGAGMAERRNLASPTLDRVTDRLVTGGVAHTERLDRAQDAGPSGYRCRVTIAAAGERWSAGPTPPSRRREVVDTAVRRLGVRLAPGRVRPGRVRVVVWT
ncbi:hypothetical protein SAMN04488065_0992 [Haloplanus vescus]|uniref:Uncharacterized protein n=1 Tax=Haloplanus vescus TaxID=555874 RepID=A0A1H3WN35_9EURY|nr:hypothetical protein [Haloplanus vescus]SDZ88360.1 hypothetical protein SAMN04488065_0992 [Haloplanus vescus]